MIFHIVKRGGARDSSKLDRLLAEYRRRKSQNAKAKLEHNHQDA
jgi:hypothetical protein